MNEGVVLLLLRRLFPEWDVARDERGGWRVSNLGLAWSGDLDGLLTLLAAADSGSARRAVRLLREGARGGCK